MYYMLRTITAKKPTKLNAPAQYHRGTVTENKFWKAYATLSTKNDRHSQHLKDMQSLDSDSDSDSDSVYKRITSKQHVSKKKSQC